MNGKTVIFTAPKSGYKGEASWRGVIIDKVIVPKKIYEHKDTAMHNSYNPEYKETVEVNAYLIQDDEEGRIHTVYPEDIIKFATKQKTS